MSTKKPAGNGTNTTVRAASRPGDIRNVVLVGHPDSGKTALVEALLRCAGTHTTISSGADTDQHHSISLGVYPLNHGDLVINLIDTPGHPDFVSDVRAGLRAAEAALFVVAANSDIDPATTALWHECEVLGTPRAVAITRLDSVRDTFSDAVVRCRTAFPGAVALQLTGGNDTEVIDLLSRSVYDHGSGQPPGRRNHDAGQDGAIDDARAELIEAIIENSEDESLLERYANGDDIELETLVADLERAVCHATFFPVVPVCSVSGVGLAELLDLMANGFPSPPERDIPPTHSLDGTDLDVQCLVDGPLVAEVVKTSVDPYLGRLTVLRVFSGSLTKDQAIHVCGRGGEQRGHPEHDSDEPIGQIFSPLGGQLRPVERVVAGDICALTRLSNAETTDTISAKASPLIVQPWPLPDPLLPIAVETPSRADEDALPKALGRLTTSDPTIRVERNPETGQLVLWCLGEAHAEVALRYLRDNGANVTQVPVRVALRRTFAGDAAGHGRLVKQSGGHGQYAVCDVSVVPLPRGSGVQFQQKVVGGAVPSQFIGSVEKGARHQLEHGLDNDGIQVTDVLVTLLDGKAHSVDSSDAAFQTAGSLAVKDAAGAGRTVLLEPLARVEIDVPDSYVGAVMSDLAGRRGRVTGTDPDPEVDGRTTVHAEVPDAELATYVVTLRAMTGGAGTFRREFARYDVMPAAVADRLLAPA
jgi:elongation factor G